MEEIVIPDLDDDDDLGLPSFQHRTAFGQGAGSPDSDSSQRNEQAYSDNNHHHHHQSGSVGGNPRTGFGPAQSRPALPKSSLSQTSSSSHIDLGYEAGFSRLGRHPNASQASLGLPMPPPQPGAALLTSRKGSFASLKNMLKPNSTPAPAVPALPMQYDSKPGGYPTLRNPFLRSETEPPPAGGPTIGRPRANTKTSMASAAPTMMYHGSKQSVATMHSSQRSYGGRSTTSQSSSNFRAEDYPLPALPLIPNRSTPSRVGRQGSDTSMFGSFGRKTSLSADEELSGKTPAEEALRVVFFTFKEAADQKIRKLLAKPLNSHISLTSSLAVGVDPAFDQLVVSVANCTRRHARRVIDLLTMWMRNQNEGLHMSEIRAHLSQSIGMQMRTEDAAAVLGSRKASAGRYIFYRTLIEIVRVVPPDALGEDVALSLEHSAFSVFRSERTEDFAHRRAVSGLLIDFLSELSKTRFLTVSDRFTRELSGLSSGAVKDQDAKIEHILKGVRKLKLRVYPEDELEVAAEFIQSLSAFFANAHGNALKVAYAETFTHLLHPVIETATAEVNHPVWAKAVAVVLQRAMTMAVKPRYWAVAFPLVIVALAVSPREIFMEHWQGCIDVIQTKCKDRAMRVIGMNAFIRLLWVYLNRCHESSTSTRKRLEGLLQGYFPPHSGQLVPSDLPLEPFVAILHYVMARQPEWGQEMVGEFLRDCVPTRNPDGSSGEVLHPERAYVAVMATTMSMRCLTNDIAVALPSNADFTRFDFPKSEDTFDKPLDTIPEAQDFIQKCGSMSINVLLACDKTVGSVLLSSDAVTLSVHASSASWDSTGEQVTRKHGDVHVGYPARYEPTFRLLAALLDPLPYLIPVAPSSSQLIHILCRATFSACPVTCEAAAETLRRVADDQLMCPTIVDNYRQFVFETQHVFRDNFVGTRLLESQLVRVVKLWVDILEKLAQQHKACEDVDPMDSHFVAKVEACGLFLLCSTSGNLRRLATPIFSAALDLGGLERGPSEPFRYSRVVTFRDAPTKTASVLQMYEHELEAADIAALRKMPTLTASDRSRLDTIKSSKLIQTVAESGSPKDAALWAAILPAFVGRVNDQLPDSVNEMRSLVGGTVFRLQPHVSMIASTAGKVSRTSPNRASSDAGILSEQWRLYLSALCVTLDPTKATPKRTKESTITTEVMMTPALFGYVTQIMLWDDRRFQDAAVYALGSIRRPAMKDVAETVLNFTRRLADANKKTRQTRTSQDAMWLEATTVFSLISPHLLEGRANSTTHIAVLSSFIGFVKLTVTLLSDRRDDYELQSLRREFCIVVDRLSTALGKLDSSDRFLGDELRGAIFKLCYEWCHVGRRPDVAKARESQTLQAAADSYRGDRDKAQYLDDIQAKTKQLSAAAAEAMASLCLGKLISAADATPAGQASDHIVEPLTVLRWVRGMFQSPQEGHHKTAKKALHALIKYNWDVERLADEVLHQSFGEGEHFALNSSFFGVVADMISDGNIELPPAQLACLSLSKLGHPVADVRQRAFQLAVWLFEDPLERVSLASLFPAIGSCAPSVYRHAQLEMATRLAAQYPDLTLRILREATSRLTQLDAPRRESALAILPPFMKVLVLEGDTSKLGPDEVTQEHQALSDLMYLVVRFSDDHLDEIREILVSFAGSGRSRNTTALVKFLFEQGAKRGNPDFVKYAQQTMACLAASPAGDIIFEEICGFVDPSDMATSAQAEVPPSPVTSQVNLDTLFMSATRTKPLSQGQMALLFAGELLPHRLAHPLLPSKLPALLHSAFVHCDDSNAAMRENAQQVLFQVLRTWISSLAKAQVLEPMERAASWTAAEAKITALASQSADLFWKIDDTGSEDTFSHALAKMSTLVAKVLGVMQQAQPKLRQQWGCLALDWATSCTVRHLACRSFQVFRILSPDISARMISDMLARLSSTMGSPSPEIQTFNNEVLWTFASVVQSLTADDMRNYPQIFWCSTACLMTPYEAEFNEVVDLFSHILDKTNLADPAVVSNLVSFRPSDWSGPPPQLQALLLIGLRSAKTDMMTFDVIRRLTSVPDSELIDEPEKRLLHGFVAALPWMLHSTDLGEPNEELACMASDLASIAEEQGNAGFARLLTSFARHRFRTKDDFIRQAASLLRDFLGTQALEVVTVLLGFVLNRNEWMRDKALQMLKLLLSYQEVGPILAPHSQELVRPLLRLVSTKHAAQALEILDLPPFTNADSSEQPDTRLFGPIDASGWSVPDANQRSEVTRNNVLAVFNTVAVESRKASAHFSVLQFSDLRTAGDAPGWGASQLSLEIPSPPMSVPDNASMGDLVGALHSLNQFFDDGLDGAPPPNGATTSPLARRTGRHFGRASSTESIPFGGMGSVRAVMARGMARSGSANVALDEAAYGGAGGGMNSGHSFTSSTDASTAHAHTGSAQSGLPPSSSGHTTHAQSPAPADVIYFAPNGTPPPPSQNLYVHSAHQPSFSSESEFGAATSENVFSLEDGGDDGGGGGASSIPPPRPHRAWDGQRSRTPSPRDGTHM